MKRAFRRPVLPTAAVVFVLLLPAVSEGHAVGAEAKLKDGVVVVEVFFDDNTPGSDSKVVVLDAGGAKITDGTADKDGRWTFNAPHPGRYKIAVDAGGGHHTTVVLSIPEPAKAPDAPAGAAADPPAGMKEGIKVSEGLSRSAFTGPMRWVWVGVGLAGIGVGTWLLTSLLRVRNARAGTK